MTGQPYWGFTSLTSDSVNICSGTFRTSPIESLQMETGEPPLDTRRLKLSLQYYMKMKTNPENPAYSCVVNPEFNKLFNNKPGTIPTLNIRLQPHLEDMEVDLDAISVVHPPECAPWLLQQPNILFNLSDLKKGDTCPLVFQSMLLELFCRFPRHRKVYTDGSKEDKRTAMSFVCDDHEFSCRLGTRPFFAGYQAILKYRAMSGLMFWPRLPWITQNSFIIYHILISSTTSLSTLMTFCKVNGYQCHQQIVRVTTNH